MAKVREIGGRVQEFLATLPVPEKLLPPAPSPHKTELAIMGTTVDVSTFLLGMIPYVGDILADIVGDNIEADMRRRFTPQERAEFTEQTRFLPSGPAAWRAVERAELRKLGGR